MGRSRRRADRIRAQISITRVLADYGYEVEPNGGDREQQFSCNLHGDGRDGKPSARAYPQSASFYCFACGRSRDAVQLVREREGVPFGRACDVLERKYGLPPLPYEPGDDDRPETASERVRGALDPTRTFAQERERVERGLVNSQAENDLTMVEILPLWEKFDAIGYAMEHDSWTEEQGKRAMLELLMTHKDLLELDES